MVDNLHILYGLKPKHQVKKAIEILGTSTQYVFKIENHKRKKRIVKISTIENGSAAYEYEMYRLLQPTQLPTPIVREFLENQTHQALVLEELKKTPTLDEIISRASSTFLRSFGISESTFHSQNHISVIAQMHNILDSIKEEYLRRNLQCPTKDHFLDIEDIINISSSTFKSKEIVDIYKRVLDYEREEQLKQQTLVHGDPKFSNFIGLGETTTIFDFERINWGSRYVDLGRFFTPQIDIISLSRRYYEKALHNTDKPDRIRKGIQLFSLLHHLSHLPFMEENNSKNIDRHISNTKQVYSMIQNNDSLSFLRN